MPSIDIVHNRAELGLFVAGLLAAARAVGRAGREDAIPYLQARLTDEPSVAAKCAAALRRLDRESS